MRLISSLVAGIVMPIGKPAERFALVEHPGLPGLPPPVALGVATDSRSAASMAHPAHAASLTIAPLASPATVSADSTAPDPLVTNLRPARPMHALPRPGRRPKPTLACAQRGLGVAFGVVALGMSGAGVYGFVHGVDIPGVPDQAMTFLNVAGSGATLLAACGVARLGDHLYKAADRRIAEVEAEPHRHSLQMA